MSADDQYISPDKQAILEEKLSLDSRIARYENKVKAAMATPGFSNMALQRLHVQVQAMHCYANILQQRLICDFE